MAGDAFDRLARSLDAPPASRVEQDSLPLDATSALTAEERDRARALLEARLDGPFLPDPRIPAALAAIGDTRSTPALRGALEAARRARHTVMRLATVDAMLALGAQLDAIAEYRSIILDAPTLAEGGLAAIARVGARSPAEAIPLAAQALRAARTSVDRAHLFSLLRSWYGVPATRPPVACRLSLTAERLRSRWSAVVKHGYVDLEQFLIDAQVGDLAGWTDPLPAHEAVGRALSSVRASVALSADDAKQLDDLSRERVRLALLEALPEAPPHVLASLQVVRNDEVRAALTEAANTHWLDPAQRAALRAAAGTSPS